MLYRPQSYHLLIVDRPRAFPEILSKFRASDVAVITARNALEAEAKLFLYGDQTIDALWINIDLPESDLERLLTAIHTDQRLKKVQVFCIGDKTSSSQAQVCRTFGVKNIIFRQQHDVGDIAHYIMGLLE
ncbi:MAG: hypothetical protein AAB733_03760 [Patescibacteria group bacterium]